MGKLMLQYRFGISRSLFRISVIERGVLIGR